MYAFVLALLVTACFDLGHLPVGLPVGLPVSSFMCQCIMGHEGLCDGTDVGCFRTNATNCIADSYVCRTYSALVALACRLSAVASTSVQRSTALLADNEPCAADPA